jgi:uncharacterized protein YneF (UPF0154 family)
MALQREDINQAYQAIFGSNPSESEIRDIMANPSYWGNNLNSVAERLTQSQRFVNQPVNEDTISRTWQTFFGSKPTPQEIQEILKTPQYWGRNVGTLKDKVQATTRYTQDPTIKVAGNVTNETLNPLLRQIGLSDDVINRLDPDTKMFYGTIGKQMLDNVEKSIPAPTTFNADTFKQLYEQARNNPKINQYYSDIQSRKVEDILNNVAIAQQDYDYTNRTLASNFSQQVQDLAAKTEQAGMAYSGIREQNKAKLAEQQAGILTSTQSQAKQRLQDIGRQAEELLGSKAVADLRIGLNQPTDLGTGVNADVASTIQANPNIGYTGYGTAINSEQSSLGQAKQAEIGAEYERLKAERNLLINPQQST